MKTVSLLMFGASLAHANEADANCAAEGTCSADEATMLQLQELRKHKAEAKHETSVPNEGTQCWHADQCDGQGGNCPSGYCGDGVCCRLGWAARNEHELMGCGPNGFGIEGMHTCQPRIDHLNTQCWHGDQCDGRGGRCDTGYCGGVGVCCRGGWACRNPKECEECGQNGHGHPNHHQCQLPQGESQYIGCFVDDADRDLGAMVGNHNADTNSFDACRAACDKAYISLQWGGECFCSETYGNGDQYVQADDSQCNHPREPCASTAFNCGGTWHQAIYQIRTPLWGQTFVDRTKCNRNIGVQIVNSRRECEAVAVAAGHEFYSFRHNANNQGHKCFSSQNCDDENGLLLGDRTNEWNVYRRSFPNPAVIRNAHSDRRIFAQDWNAHEQGTGAGAGENLWADQIWIIEDAGDGNDAYIIRNRHSGRRLFAQDSGNHQDGVGAADGGEIYADQKWFIVPTDDGKYVIRNVHSGRRLFAQANKQHEDGFGAGNGDTIYADQKWYIHSIDDLPDGVHLA